MSRQNQFGLVVALTHHPHIIVAGKWDASDGVYRRQGHESERERGDELDRMVAIEYDQGNARAVRGCP